jgi:glycerophosphoryl diester phosphodiesterase|tara:strand:+ start:203 stop:1099 length:897 start_codon:yes stop_codon:yes gene_type:complete
LKADIIVYLKIGQTNRMISENIHPFFQGYKFFGFVHRGGDEKKTENTLEAFQYSSDLGFVFMETDVQSTSDGRVVIFHDADLKRIAGIDKKIKDLTFDEVTNIDLINGGKIPSLEETLFSFPNLRFNIDIKTNSAVEESIKIIKSQEALTRVCLASFSNKRIRRIRKLAGSQSCTSMSQLEVVNAIFHVLAENLGSGINLRRKMRGDEAYFKSKWMRTTIPFNGIPDCAQVPVGQWGIPIVTQSFIRIMNLLGKFVHVWTIDEPEEMNRLIDLGVDGLMTDKPSILKSTLIDRGLFNY